MYPAIEFYDMSTVKNCKLLINSSKSNLHKETQTVIHSPSYLENRLIFILKRVLKAEEENKPHEDNQKGTKNIDVCN